MNFPLCEKKRIKILFSSETLFSLETSSLNAEDTRTAPIRCSVNCLMDFEREQKAKGETYKGRKTGV